MLLAMKTRNQLLVRFDPSIVIVQQSSIDSQIVSSPVTLRAEATFSRYGLACALAITAKM